MKTNKVSAYHKAMREKGLSEAALELDGADLAAHLERLRAVKGELPALIEVYVGRMKEDVEAGLVLAGLTDAEMRERVGELRALRAVLGDVRRDLEVVLS